MDRYVNESNHQQLRNPRTGPGAGGPRINNVEAQVLGNLNGTVPGDCVTVLSLNDADRIEHNQR